MESLGPLDGRYKAVTSELSRYFSESAYITRRVAVESRWLLRLLDLPSFAAQAAALTPSVRTEIQRLATCDTDTTSDTLRSLTVRRVKELEKETNHDVKAIEYCIREVIVRACGSEKNADVAKMCELVHFGLTSEDVNNVAQGRALQESISTVIAPQLQNVLRELERLSRVHSGSAMLAMTHGQPATPTTFGKEMAVFLVRVRDYASRLTQWRAKAKFNGATGNYSALTAAVPGVDWPKEAAALVEGFGLTFQPHSTQIECHDCIGDLGDLMAALSAICTGLCQDLWLYISRRLVRLQVVRNEVGSSTMPHKVNPIDFENAEGNFGLAAALGRHMSQKLRVSRMQRDLSDSTTLRNLGVLVGYFLVALCSLIKGLRKIDFDCAAAQNELQGQWEVLAEPIQTVLRAHGVPNSYELLKQFFRGSTSTTADYDGSSARDSSPGDAKLVTRRNTTISREYVETFLRTHAAAADSVPGAAIEQLLAMTPTTYVGLAPRLALEAADSSTLDCYGQGEGPQQQQQQ